MRKLMWFTIGFTVAVAVGSYVLAMQWYLLAAGACAAAMGICLVLLLRFRKVRIAAMALGGAIAGFCFFAIYDAAYLSVARAVDEVQLEMTLTAADHSYETDYGCAVMGKVTVNGRRFSVLTYLPEDTKLLPGDTVTGSFLLRSTLPGSSRESSYYCGDGVFLKAYPKGDLLTGSPETMPLSARPAYIRSYISTMIDALFPPDTAAFAKALLLGITDDLSYETDTALKISGIRHVVAVSGLHVSILFSMVSSLVGRKKWLSALLGMPVLFLFAAVAGFSPSINRACIMHGLMLLSLLVGKEYDPPTALSCAVLVMLIVNPWSLTNVGFQLSAASVAGILVLSKPISGWLLDKKRLGRFRGRWIGWLSSGISVSISASVFTVPLCANYFGLVSILAVVTNLLTLWIVSFIFCGIMLCCGAAMIHAPLGAAIAWGISWPIRYVLTAAKWIAKLPIAAVYTVSAYAVVWLVLCYVLLAVYLLMRNKRPMILGCCAALSLCVALLASWTEPLVDECRVTVLDVGQGQCILLQSEGKNFLVDCGGSDEKTAADRAAALLLSQGVTKLDGLILTHYDADHAAGAQYLLTRLDADCLYLPNCVDADGTGESLYRYTGGTLLTVQENVVITFGAAKITLVPSKNNLSSNESGLCVLFQTENCDILITGDRSANGERELMQQIELPELEVLVVGHHGSKYSTCRELLLTTKPQYAFISVGAENTYGHPAQEVLERLQAFGCTVYRTDQNQTIVFRR